MWLSDEDESLEDWGEPRRENHSTVLDDSMEKQLEDHDR